MTESPPVTGKPAPTDVRFSVRSLLMVTAVVAMVATSLGAFVRQFPDEAQLRLWVYWGVLVALMGGMSAFNAWRRYLAEKKAGQVLFQFVPHSYFLPYTPRFAAVAAGVLLMAWAPAVWIVGSFDIAKPGPINWGFFLSPGIVYAGFFSGLGITFLWWSRSIRVAEHGLVVRHKFVPWDEFRRYYWDVCYRGVVVLEIQFLSIVAARVPAEERQALVALLDKKMKSVDKETGSKKSLAADHSKA